MTTPEEYIREQIDDDIRRIRDALMAMQEQARFLATARAEHATEEQLPDIAMMARQLAEGLTMAQVSIMMLNVTTHDEEEEVESWPEQT